MSSAKLELVFANHGHGIVFAAVSAAGVNLFFADGSGRYEYIGHVFDRYFAGIGRSGYDFT